MNIRKQHVPQVASYGFADHCWMVECSICGPLGSVFSASTDEYAFAHLREAHNVEGVKQ